MGGEAYDWWPICFLYFVFLLLILHYPSWERLRSWGSLGSCDIPPLGDYANDNEWTSMLFNLAQFPNWLYITKSEIHYSLTSSLTPRQKEAFILSRLYISGRVFWKEETIKVRNWFRYFIMRSLYIQGNPHMIVTRHRWVMWASSNIYIYIYTTIHSTVKCIAWYNTKRWTQELNCHVTWIHVVRNSATYPS